MATTMANTYYVKALNAYPWYLDEFLEAINYALSYDEDHADAHCLFGRFYMDQLYKFADARYHFDKALAADPHNVLTYYAYIRLCVNTGEYNKARKLMKTADKVYGIEKTYIKHFGAIILEKEGEFKAAKAELKSLLKEETSNWVRTYLKNELNRVKEKMRKKSSSKKRKGKKKKK